MKENLYKTNAAIWYNKICRPKQLTPKHVPVKNVNFFGSYYIGMLNARFKKRKVVGRVYDSGAKSVYANSLQNYAVGSSEKVYWYQKKGRDNL
jgi:hypothetical protein